MTLVVLDYAGVWHQVYNKTEIVSARMSRGDWVENWQVRTRCCRDEEPAFLHGIQRATIDDGVPTCVRCVAMPCDHGITFDAGTASRLQMNSTEVRKRWPRLDGVCPKGCGYHGIAYASLAHYVFGDW